MSICSLSLLVIQRVRKIVFLCNAEASRMVVPKYTAGRVRFETLSAPSNQASFKECILIRFIILLLIFHGSANATQEYGFKHLQVYKYEYWLSL